VNATKFTLFVANSRKVRCTVLQENSSNEGRVTDEKYFVLQEKEPSLLTRSQPNVHSLQGMRDVLFQLNAYVQTESTLLSK